MFIFLAVIPAAEADDSSRFRLILIPVDPIGDLVLGAALSGTPRLLDEEVIPYSGR